MNIRLTNIDTCAAYLRSKGLTFKPGSVSITKQPCNKSMTCYKYNVTISNSAGKQVRLWLFGSGSEFINNKPASAWDVIYAYFSDALYYVENHDTFLSSIESTDMEVCKKMWQKLSSLGLSNDDIMEIANRASEETE